MELEQHRLRLGKFTGSSVGVLLESSKSGSDFGTNALKYIDKKVVERLVLQRVVDDEDKFSEFIARHEKSGSSARYGNDLEDYARVDYEETYNRKVDKCGFIQINDYLGASPDGKVIGESIGIEIKCPTPTSHIYYIEHVKTQLDIQKIPLLGRNYYAQTQTEILALGVDELHWISSDYMMMCPLHVVKVYPDEVYIKTLLNKVKIANEIVEERVYNILNNPLKTEKLCQQSISQKKICSLL